jgi:ABC-type transport system involved in multi-copper enzyme maturation permease subunit
MLREVFRFELRYQLRQPLFWLVFFILGVMTFGAEVSDGVQVGGGIGNVHRNAPFVILQLLSVMSVIGMLVTTAFVAGSIHRDVEHGTEELFFSTRLGKGSYLFGRFGGALAATLLVYLGP